MKSPSITPFCLTLGWSSDSGLRWYSFLEEGWVHGTYTGPRSVSTGERLMRLGADWGSILESFPEHPALARLRTPQGAIVPPGAEERVVLPNGEKLNLVRCSGTLQERFAAGLKLAVNSWSQCGTDCLYIATPEGPTQMASHVTHTLATVTPEELVRRNLCLLRPVPAPARDIEF